jgi:hypothetical protein
LTALGALAELRARDTQLLFLNDDPRGSLAECAPAEDVPG